MAIGDDAAAAGMSVVDGATLDAADLDQEINRTRDYIATGAGAVSAATANKVVKRDSAGRFRAATPSNSGDVATKGYVDALGTPLADADTIVRRTSDGRAKVTAPTFAEDIANKAYVDGVEDAMQAWVEADMLPKADVIVSTGGGTIANKVPRYDGSGRLAAGTPTASNHVVTKAYVDGQTFNGGTVSGQIYLPNAFAASSGYTIAYINGDGRISQGASSERYKDHITLIEALALGSVFPDLYEYVMKNDPEQTPRLGHIAERLAEDPALERFVVYKSEPIIDQPGPISGSRLVLDDNGNPIPESIDFIALLLTQTAQLHARVAALEAVSQTEGE